MTKPKRKIDLFACHTDELHLLVVMSFTCVFLPFYIKVYYCEMFGFFSAFFGGVFGFFMFWQSGNPGLKHCVRRKCSKSSSSHHFCPYKLTTLQLRNHKRQSDFTLKVT